MAKTSSAKTKKPAKAKSEAAPAAKAVGQVADKARILANNPVVTEVVAATLVAAAAALKNPAKARALAESAADELKEAGKGAATHSGPIWMLAMDIARRSVAALGDVGTGGGEPKKANKPQKPKPDRKAVKAKKAEKPAKVKKAKKAKKA